MNKPIKIAIIGYGKMGHEIEKYAPTAGCEVIAIVDQSQHWKTHHDQLKQADVAIEFTSPEVVTDNLKKLMDMQVPVVTGTTGWMQHLEDIKHYCSKSNGSVFYASNFSIGVNLFFALNRYLAELMSPYPEYNITLDETHHTQKLDAPSGTALSMLDDVIRIHPSVENWKFANQQPGKNEIAVTAHRIEGVTGTHQLTYASDIDSISIEHKANNREGFAKGALMAARWLHDKKGVFTMNDLLKL